MTVNTIQEGQFAAKTKDELEWDTRGDAPVVSAPCVGEDGGVTIHPGPGPGPTRSLGHGDYENKLYRPRQPDTAITFLRHSLK